MMPPFTKWDTIIVKCCCQGKCNVNCEAFYSDGYRKPQVELSFYFKDLALTLFS